MSRWSKMKVALLTATTVLSTLALGSCLGDNLYQRILQYVVVGTLFD